MPKVDFGKVGLTFEQLRAIAAQLPAGDKEGAQIQIALAEHIVEALDRIREAVMLSTKITAALQGADVKELNEE